MSKSIFMANRTMIGDGKRKKSKEGEAKSKRIDASCGDDKGNCETTKVGGKKDGSKQSRYRKEVVYTEKSNEPTQTKVVEKSKLVVSDAINEQNKPETKGITFEGQTSQKTTDSGNKSAGKDDMSRVLETRYFKRRNKIGRLLTGETEKKMGGKIESQTRAGVKDVTTFKGKGRSAKMFTEKGNVVEEYKGKYDKEKKEQDDKIIKDFGAEERLASMPYASKKVAGGTDKDYQLGNRTDKEWRTDKKSYESDVTKVRKANKKIDVKVKKPALQKLRVAYGKA